MNLASIKARFSRIGGGSVRLKTLRQTEKAVNACVEGLVPGTTIAALVLDNQTRRNAISPKMMAELAEHISLLERTINVDVPESVSMFGLVICGSGTTFCSGFDLSVAREQFMTKESGMEMSMLMQDSLQRLKMLPLHTIAAVDGYALGGGAELSMAADARIMSHRSTMQFLQTRMGVSTGWGGATWLSQALGPDKALRILSSGERMDAQQCLDLGISRQLVNVDALGTDDVHKQGYLDVGVASAAANALEELALDGQAYPHVLRAIKQAVLGSIDCNGINRSLKNELDMFGSLWGGIANRKALARPRR